MAGLIRVRAIDRRQRDVAAVSRAIELRTLTPLEAWRVAGKSKVVAR